MFEEKRKLLARYTYKNTGKPVIGIPMGLNMYELLPFWYKFFTTLGYDVMTSPASNRQLYLKGQHTIPSDTACFPAKLMHGHVEALLDAGVQPQVSQREDAGTLFAGMTFVLTGTLPTLTRAQAEEIILHNGGKTAGSVSKKTSVVLAGESAGSKLQKAQTLGVRIMEEEEFLSLVKSAQNKAQTDA